MGMNKQKGNMYEFITDTWNPIRGKCLHDCSYCYMKKGPLAKTWDQEAHLVEKELKTNLGKGNSIFVGSSTDMWGEWVGRDDLLTVLKHCSRYDNKYLFQTKNPWRYDDFDKREFPAKTILGTTIETNRCYSYGSECLDIVLDRADAIQILREERGFKVSITIEPIMDFDLDTMVEWVEEIKPEWIAIGADSGNNKLDEPGVPKIRTLIDDLKKITKVILKPNIKRIIG